jgi:hypothetical protein
MTMQKCQFSETQFSFCFTFEYIKKFFPFVPLPIFPNTVEEGREGGGYDVLINGNIYFQFKIPVYYGQFPKYRRKYWNVFGHDYFRIKLETNEYQFKLLKDLQSPGNEVYYATPEFYNSTDLATFYTTNNIVSHSALFSLDNLPPYQSGYHHLIYSPQHQWGKLFSEPKELNKVKTINPFELFPKDIGELTIYEQALKISKILMHQEYKPSIQFEFNPNRPAQLVKEVYTVLLTDYNTHWYPVIMHNTRRK